MQNRNQFLLLLDPLKDQISQLINSTLSLEDVFDSLKKILTNIRFILILDVIKKIIGQNSYLSSQKIFDILDLIKKHKNLEEKLEIIIKGERFKVLLFLFLLP